MCFFFVSWCFLVRFMCSKQTSTPLWVSWRSFTVVIYTSRYFFSDELRWELFGQEIEGVGWDHEPVNTTMISSLVLACFWVSCCFSVCSVHV